MRLKGEFVNFLNLKKMNKEKKPSLAGNFFESIKNDPQAILEWCDSGIREYQKLKKLILKQC